MIALVRTFCLFLLAISVSFSVAWFGINGLAYLHDRFGTMATFGVMAVGLAAVATAARWAINRQRPHCR